MIQRAHSYPNFSDGRCAMRLFKIKIPDEPLTNIELSTYARELKVPHFRGVLCEIHYHDIRTA